MEEIKKYIKQQLEAGASRETIEKNLQGAGWTPENIQNAFVSFDALDAHKELQPDINKKMSHSLSTKIILGIILATLFFGYIYHLYVLVFGLPAVTSVGMISFAITLSSFFFFPFIFPYVRFGQQNWILRGVLFGLVMWFIDVAQVLSFLYESLVQFTGLPSIIMFIFGLPTVFVILGVVTSYVFCKKFPVEYEKHLVGIKTSITKTTVAFVAVVLGYVSFMYIIQLKLQIPFYLEGDWGLFLSNGLHGIVKPILSISFFLNIIAIIFFYILFLQKALISKTKKCFLTGATIFLFTTPYLFIAFGTTTALYIDPLFDMQIAMIQNMLNLPFLLLSFFIAFILVEMLPGTVQSDEQGDVQEGKYRVRFFVPVLVILISVFVFLLQEAQNMYTPTTYLESLPPTDIEIIDITAEKGNIKHEETENFLLETEKGDIIKIELEL